MKGAGQTGKVWPAPRGHRNHGVVTETRCGIQSGTSCNSEAVSAVASIGSIGGVSGTLVACSGSAWTWGTTERGSGELGASTSWTAPIAVTLERPAIRFSSDVVFMGVACRVVALVRNVA